MSNVPERSWGELPDRYWWVVPALTASAATYQLVTQTSAGRWGPPEIGVPIFYALTVVVLVQRWRVQRSRRVPARFGGPCECCGAGNVRHVVCSDSGKEFWFCESCGGTWDRSELVGPEPQYDIDEFLGRQGVQLDHVLDVRDGMPFR